MLPLDAVEYERWLAAAGDALEVARYTADGDHHHAAVLHAEQAVQCALKALLRGVGEASRARGHDLLALARATDSAAGLTLSSEQLDLLADLARAYQPTRYPDALPGGTPREHFGSGASGRAIDAARTVLEAVERQWTALLEQEDDESGPLDANPR